MRLTHVCTQTHKHKFHTYTRTICKAGLISDSACTILQIERVQYNMLQIYYDYYKTYNRARYTLQKQNLWLPPTQQWDTCCALDKSSLHRINNLQKTVSCLVDEDVGPYQDHNAHVHVHTLHLYTHKNKSKAFWLPLSGHIYPGTSTGAPVHYSGTVNQHRQFLLGQD